MAAARLAQLPAGSRARLRGRVLAVDPGGEGAFTLGDASGTARLGLGGDAAPRAGDIVEVVARAGAAGAACEQRRVLTPYRRSRPFPSPGGEYFRVHGARPSRAAALERRARCLRAIRSFFDERGYLEVQTPHLVQAPGLEPHLTALPAGQGGYLITSPEYHMKRLLAGGLERIYFLGPCWRGDERGPQHLPEFCMLEWYCAHSTLEELMGETEALLAHVARQVLGTTRLSYQGSPIELGQPFVRVTVAEAFARHAGVQLAGVTDAAELGRRAEAAGLGPFAADAPFEEVASRILVERVEPALRGARPRLLHDFPAPLAALSRLRPDDPTVAERFELYAGGLELANAFGELTDPEEQRARLEADQRARRAAGRPVYPLDERFVEALREGMPPAAGIALGVDRLVMLLCDAADIGQVAAFAPEEI